MLGTTKQRQSNSSFESLAYPNISDNLDTMLAPTKLSEDDYFCETTVSQKKVEQSIRQIYEDLGEKSSPGEVYDQEIKTELHLSYVEHFLDGPLPGPFFKLDSSQLWMIYWLVNAHVVLSGEDPLPSLKQLVSEKANALILDDGRSGIAGGPNDTLGHVASTYAVILLLVLVEDYKTLSRMKENLLEWLFTLKHENGSFAMHYGGECDTRSTYCVLVVSSLLNMPTKKLWAKTREWVSSCQTYEGGFAGVPGTEAHGGYTFCAVASFFLLGRDESDFDKNSLLRWLADRQLGLEGGFSGRSNKLVDACYSFWVGASYVLLESESDFGSLYNRQALITYIKNCCQDVQRGGLKDKPSTNPDFYHTNYALCGLSMAEYCYTNPKRGAYSFEAKEALPASSYSIPVSPVFGIPLRHVERLRERLHIV